MSQTLHRMQKVTAWAIAAAWTVFWTTISIVTHLPPTTAAYGLVFTTALWAGAAVFMMRRWWSESSESILDAPGLMLAAAVAAP